ncbi:Gp37-like protein [Williamsia phyllosphaerae]|uniref:Gp28/Gp37-like domain-containing protein n=1 Tax=Williamsia phyllosphaerae TaxID=885042 RepID=A0ABQ1V6H5_9NOCA|nr:hypothetical protein [Williamsia phyllosphaerae]GGF39182.1 hypothetical protein GCM10007298_38590 [Williamsia phyllosphaerae]
MTANVVPFAGSNLDDFAMWAREIRETRIARIAKPPRITLYDGNWNYRGVCANLMADGSSVELKYNDTGAIHLELPISLDSAEAKRSTFLAHWALDQESRGTSNIHVIVEKDGARIGGRTDPEKGVTLIRSKDGDKVVLEFLEDTQELKHVHMAASPFLPVSLVQQPKEQFLWAPVDWGGLSTLGWNMLRVQGTNFNVNFDLLDPSTHSNGLWAQTQIVPMPKPIGSSVAPTTIITGNIKQSWFDVMAPILEDAELMIKTRRFLKGDPEPWPGAGTNWRQGTLFVDIVDKSGWQAGTSLGGNLATGLLRSIANVTSNYVEDSYDLITGAPVDTTGYKLPGVLGTQPPHPYVVYRDGDVTGVQDFQLTRGAGGPCRITAGGQSMPGVNELFEAAIGYAGDVIGDNINIAGYGVGSLGGILNAFLMPIIKNSVLAYMSVPLIGRAAQQGWGHYIETSATNVTQAYTPTAIMDLRKRRRETDPDTAFSFTVASGIPWLIGDNGQGHWWLGDRVGATTKYLGARVYVTRCRSMTLPISREEPAVWQAKFGDLRTQQDALEKLVGLVGTTATALNAIGIG